MKTYACIGAITSALSVASLAVAEPTASGLVLRFSDMESDRGTVRCKAWPDAEGYPMDAAKAVAEASCKPRGKRAMCVFKDLPQGTYAIGCFHDENDNGALDTNFLGIPKEGIAASNNSTRTFGPPRFDDAKVRFAGALTQTLELAY